MYTYLTKIIKLYNYSNMTILHILKVMEIELKLNLTLISNK